MTAGTDSVSVAAGKLTMNRLTSLSGNLFQVFITIFVFEKLLVLLLGSYNL